MPPEEPSRPEQVALIDTDKQAGWLAGQIDGVDAKVDAKDARAAAAIDALSEQFGAFKEMLGKTGWKVALALTLAWLSLIGILVGILAKG